MCSRAAGLPFARFLLTTEYLGDAFSGSASNATSSLLSVQSSLNGALAELPLASSVAAVLSSRTDAGVHAAGNTFHVDVWRGPGLRTFPKWLDDRGFTPPAAVFTARELQGFLNHKLGGRTGALGVTDVREVPRLFHARFSAAAREYVYRLSPRPFSVLADRAVWRCGAGELNIPAMQDAASEFLGTHDFSAFRSSGCSAKSPIRTIDVLEVSRWQTGPSGDDVEVRVRVKSRGFLYNQVRIMVAALLKAGRGELTAGELQKIIASGDRDAAPPPAPAHGLTLLAVEYPKPTMHAAEDSRTAEAVKRAWEIAGGVEISSPWVYDGASTTLPSGSSVSLTMSPHGRGWCVEVAPCMVGAGGAPRYVASGRFPAPTRGGLARPVAQQLLGLCAAEAEIGRRLFFPDADPTLTASRSFPNNKKV